MVYGIADRRTFFVFDPAARQIIHQRSLLPELAESISQQGPRPFVTSETGQTYLLLTKGIARIDPSSHAVTLQAKSPQPIEAGGDYLDGRIYFITSSHLQSYKLPPASAP